MTRILDPLSGDVVDVDASVVPLVEELWTRLRGQRATSVTDADSAALQAERDAAREGQADKDVPVPAGSEPDSGRARPGRRPGRLIVPWQPAELARVRAGLPGRYQLMTDLGAALGLRQGEVFGFSLDDLDHAAYRVRTQVKRVDGVLCFAPPKHERERSVPVEKPLRPAIAAHIAQYGTVRVTLPWIRPAGQPRTLTLLHVSQHRTPLDRAYINRLWKTAVLSAGITWIPQDTGMHMLRHIAASEWIAAGADLIMVRDLLGHGDTATTERYLHRLKTHDQRTRNVVAKAQRRRTPPRPAQLPAGVADLAAWRTRKTS